MSKSLGLDHALVAVRDIEIARETYMALGFLSRGFSQHPWGTSTTVLIFQNQLFEIVGIGDPSLLDGYETGGFLFGRHVEANLNQREGVALTALNSVDAEADATALEQRGVSVTGSIDFGRDVTRADGTTDRTRTRLKVMFNPHYPRLSLFACQQFRRDLIEYPEWMDHPNGVTAIVGFTVLSPATDLPNVADWFARVHDTKVIRNGAVWKCPTAKGSWAIMNEAEFRANYGAVPDGTGEGQSPAIAAIDLATMRPEDVARRAEALGLSTLWRDDILVLPDADRLGGVCLRFGRFDD